MLSELKISNKLPIERVRYYGSNLASRRKKNKSEIF